MTDEAITRYSLTHNKLVCRNCGQAAYSHLERWTAESGIHEAQVECYHCGHVEWRPIRQKG